jgi:hypothetical protein
MFGVYLERSSWVAGITFFIAFALTCWPSRRSIMLAAVLYCIGTLTNLGTHSYIFLSFALMGWGMSDSSAQSFPIFGWLFPLWIAGYGVACCVFLLPFISRRRAIFAGRILHLVVLPPLVIFLMISSYHGMHHLMPIELSWLVYPLLWFRIRDWNFDPKSNTALEPTATAP